MVQLTRSVAGEGRRVLAAAPAGVPTFPRSKSSSQPGPPAMLGRSLRRLARGRLGRTQPTTILMKVLLLPVLVLIAGCRPVAVRAGEGTNNESFDTRAMSLTLDKVDIDYMVQENLKTLYGSRFWSRDVEGAAESRRLAIWPIQNATSQHLDDQMDTVLNSLTTSLIQNGEVTVVARDRQTALARELGVQGGGAFDPHTAGRLGRQLGVHYFLTGKVSSIDEKIKGTRRVQYKLFIQVIEIETGAIRFQGEVSRTKGLKS